MEQKVALVTGGARGIGAAVAKTLAQSGYTIALHYRSSEKAAQQVVESCPGGKAFQAELSDPVACEKLFSEANEAFGHVDVLVNNAGLAIDQILPRAKAADFEKMLDVNLKSAFHLSRLAGKAMMRKRDGCIINITSVVGHTGNMGQSMYAATKGALTSFTKSIALDMARFGIRANCVAPGFIETDMTDVLPETAKDELLGRIPLGRMGTGDEVAQAVAFLASNNARYITGTTLHVNGGLFMA